MFSRRFGSASPTAKTFPQLAKGGTHAIHLNRNEATACLRIRSQVMFPPPLLPYNKVEPPRQSKALPKDTTALQALAARVLALPKISSHEWQILNDLGHDAVDAAIRACQRAKPEHLETLLSIICHSATPADTPKVFLAMRWLEAHPIRHPPFVFGYDLRDWLNHHGDADYLRGVRFEFPPFRSLGPAPFQIPFVHRTPPTLTAARIQLAHELCQAKNPNEEQMSTLEALGHDALDAELRAGHTLDSPRRYFLATLIAKFATAPDTPAVDELLRWIEKDARPGEAGYTNAEKILGDWMLQKGDPDFYLRYRNPNLLSSDYENWRQFLPLLSRSNDPRVVNRFFSLLKSPTTPASQRQEIYQFIAATERPDVLDWIRERKDVERKRSTPLSKGSDADDLDHDGIPNRWDRNPETAERPLSEEESVVQTAVEALFKFVAFNDPWSNDRFGPDQITVRFPYGYAPFELFGLDKTITAVSEPNPAQHSTRRYDASIILVLNCPNPGRLSPPFEPPRKVLFPSGTTTATVTVASDGRGPTQEIVLRKIAREWFVVNVISLKQAYYGNFVDRKLPPSWQKS